jgi:hypothetical protein
MQRVHRERSGGARRCARAGALRGHEGSREDVHSSVVQSSFVV